MWLRTVGYQNDSANVGYVSMPGRGGMELGGLWRGLFCWCCCRWFYLSLNCNYEAGFIQFASPALVIEG